MNLKKCIVFIQYQISESQLREIREGDNEDLEEEIL